MNSFSRRDSRPCQGAHVARVIHGIVGGPSSRRGPGGMLGSWLPSAGGSCLDSFIRSVPSWNGQKINQHTGRLFEHFHRNLCRLFVNFHATQKRNRRGQILFHIGSNLVTRMTFISFTENHPGTESTDTHGCESWHVIWNTDFRLKNLCED